MPKADDGPRDPFAMVIRDYGFVMYVSPYDRALLAELQGDIRAETVQTKGGDPISLLLLFCWDNIPTMEAALSMASRLAAWWRHKSESGETPTAVVRCKNGDQELSLNLSSPDLDVNEVAKMAFAFAKRKT